MLDLHETVEGLGRIYIEIFAIDLESTGGVKGITLNRYCRRNNDVFRYAVERQVAADLYVESTVFQASFDVSTFERDLWVFRRFEYDLI